MFIAVPKTNVVRNSLQVFHFLGMTNIVTVENPTCHAKKSQHPCTLAGWWFQSLWKMMEFVNWDDDIPNSSQLNGKLKAMFQTTNQYIDLLSPY